jgi:hypothetical protein
MEPKRSKSTRASPKKDGQQLSVRQGACAMIQQFLPRPVVGRPVFDAHNSRLSAQQLLLRRVNYVFIYSICKQANKQRGD